MSATYRLVHFAPDPFTGARFPLGAVVTDADGGVHVAQATHLPSADCLGSRDLAVAVQRLHARLWTVDDPHRLPPAFGPYATLDEPRDIPASVRDPVAWVESMLSPGAPGGRHVSTPRGVQRATQGYRFFETYKVDRYVRKTFRPESDWGGWLGRHASGLPQVSHWVPGETHLLLMEPIVATRRQFDGDLKDVAVKLGAYRYATTQAENGRRAQIIAYITGGGPPDRRAEARSRLEPFADRVVDTSVDAERSSFLGRIRDLGERGDPQGSLVQ